MGQLKRLHRVHCVMCEAQCAPAMIEMRSAAHEEREQHNSCDRNMITYHSPPGGCGTAATDSVALTLPLNCGIAKTKEHVSGVRLLLRRLLLLTISA